MERMLRPLPPITNQECALESGDDKELINIMVSNDKWAVGNLVDWWCNDCWWMATITKIFDNQTVQVSLPSPPLGEGGVYTAAMNVLRPSFCWSEKHTWCKLTSQVISSKSLPTCTTNTERREEYSATEQSEVGSQEFPSTCINEPQAITDLEIAHKKDKCKTLPAWKELRLFVKGYVSLFCKDACLEDHADDASMGRRSQGKAEGSHDLKPSSGRKRKADDLDLGS